MKRFLLGLVGVAAFSATASAHTLYPQDADGVNLRKGPGTHYPIVGTLAYGQGLPVVGKELNWYKVSLPDGSIAYAASWVTRLVYDDEQAYAVVTTDVLNVRAGPGLDAPILGQIRQGDRVPLKEVWGDWWRITYQGRDAWVYGAYVREEVPPTNPAPPAPPGGTAPPAKSPAPPAPQPVLPLGLKKGVALAVPRAEVLRGRDRRYETLQVVQPGDGLTYIDSVDGWVQVYTGAGVLGWLPGNAVALWDDAVPFAQAAFYRVGQGSWSAAFLPVRTVTPPEGLNLRAEPSLRAPVQAALPRGTTVKVIDQQGVWQRVMLADGRQGWVFGEYLADAAMSQPRVRSATLRQTAPGVLALEVTGDLAGAAVRSEAGGLLVAVPDPYGRPAGLAVGSYGVQELLVTAQGVLVRGDNLPAWRVVSQAPDRLVVELRPAVTAVTARTENGTDVYRFQVQGEVRPATAVDGREVVVTFPGAELRAPLPPLARASATAAGLEVRIPSQRPFALKPVPGGVELHLFPPGLAGRTIVVDPGHGGPDPGAISPVVKGLTEEQVNLDVALQVKALLEARGARVVLTRQSDAAPVRPQGARTDSDLEWRTVIAQQAGADLFLSIHANAAGSAEQGTETYWCAGNFNSERSQYLAGLVQRELVGALGRKDRGVKENIFYVVKFAQAPAVLAELGFLTHPEEARLLADPQFRARAAAAIARAVEAYFAERVVPSK